jgi:hypothetical protein
VVEIQICEVGALPAPFSIAHQWVGIVKSVGLPWLQQTAFSCCDCGNQGMYFTIGSEIKLNNKLSRMKWNYVRPD